MAFVVSDDTLAANHDLISLTEVLGFLLGVFDAELSLLYLLFLLFLTWLFGINLLKQILRFFIIQTVKYRKVFDQLFDIWWEVGATSWTGQNIACPQIH